ncbi:MAG: repressor LexA [Nitrospiraceae bacterium]|nr:MAG: repressor LexA [Nitrospiraceae bacterium]
MATIKPGQPTARQLSVFEFIKKHIIKKGVPPTVREVAAHFGFASPLSAQLHINALVKKGLLKKLPFKQRALEISGLRPAEDTTLPLLGRVRAGAPLLASEDTEDHIRIDKGLFKIEDGFALRVTGDSMMEAGIFEGDIAIVKQQQTIENGEIGVVLIGDEATVKRVFRQKGKIVLKPENKTMKPATYNAEDVRVLGKVVGIIRKM